MSASLRSFRIHSYSFSKACKQCAKYCSMKNSKLESRFYEWVPQIAQTMTWRPLYQTNIWIASVTTDNFTETANIYITLFTIDVRIIITITTENIAPAIVIGRKVKQNKNKSNNSNIDSSPASKLVMNWKTIAVLAGVRVNIPEIGKVIKTSTSPM